MMTRILRCLCRGDEKESSSPPPLRFTKDNDRYSAFEVGDWTYGDPNVVSFPNCSKLKIGRYCSIAGGVTIFLGGEHRLDWITTYPFSALTSEGKSIEGHPQTKGDVIIGNDVWIGQEAFILSGVVIGDGAVIGARSVVTNDIPPYSVVAGNPARVIRERFPELVIKDLLRIAWWNWPEDRIRQAIPDLLSADIESFVAKYRTR